MENEKLNLNNKELYEQCNDQGNIFIWKKHENMGYYSHFHAAVEICFILEGQMEAELNREVYSFKAGDIFVVNPFEIHKYKRTDKAIVSVLIFNKQFLSDFKVEYDNKVFKNHLSNKEFNEKIFEILKDTPYSFENSTLSNLEKKAYINLVLAKIVFHYGLITPTTSHNKIMEIIEYIYKNYNQKITLETLSQKFNYTKTSLSRLLSTYLKVDLRVFLNTLRVEQVELMLTDAKFSHLPIIQIATLCGFDSAATFYRAYKQQYKQMPNSPATVRCKN